MVQTQISRKRRKGTQEDLAVTVDTSRDPPQGTTWRNHAKQEESSELPMFNFDEIVAATNNFSLTSKLGKGGFGPGFKGKLQDGQEITVKRLSSSSGQGIEEFKNEIVLISKLQHAQQGIGILLGPWVSVLMEKSSC